MSDETNAAVAEAPPQTTAYEKVFDDPFGGSPATSPVAQAVAEEMAAEVEAPEQGDDLPGVEMTVEEILKQYGTPQKAEAAPAQEPAAEEVAEEDEVAALLANLNELAAQALGVQAVPAPTEVKETPEPAPAAAPVKPVQAQPDFKLDMSYDELTDTITDPEKFRDFLTSFGQKVKLDTMAEMQNAMVQTIFEVNRAERLEARIKKEHPKLAELGPQFAVLAMRQAMAAVPSGDDDALMDEFGKRVRVVTKKVDSIKQSAKKDVRGKSPHQASTRTARPSVTTPRPDPTQEAFGMINSVSSGPGSEVLRLFG